MIEGGAILAVLFVSLLIFVISRAASPRGTPEEQRVRLTEHIARLEQSLVLAEQKSWDPAMRAGISGQLEDAQRELAELKLSEQSDAEQQAA